MFAYAPLGVAGGPSPQNLPRTNLPDYKDPRTKTPRTIEREFVQGLFVRVFCSRPTKNGGGSEMCDVLWGVSGFWFAHPIFLTSLRKRHVFNKIVIIRPTLLEREIKQKELNSSRFVCSSQSASVRSQSRLRRSGVPDENLL